MELLGPNLEELLHFVGGKFSLKTIIMVAFQVNLITFLYTSSFTPLAFNGLASAGRRKP